MTLRPRIPRRKSALKVIGVLLVIAAVAAGVKAELIPDLNGLRDTLPLVSAAPMAATPTLSISPSTAVPNESIVIFGANFSAVNVAGGTGPNGTHQITGSGVSVITLGGPILQSPFVSYPIDLDSGGSWVANVIIPATGVALISGSLQVWATDSGGASASAGVNIRSRTITLDPIEGRLGSVIKVKGVGFPARNGSSPDLFNVNIDYNGRFLMRVTPDSTGEFEATITVPINALIPSTNFVRATVAGTAADATAEHKVPAATISISPQEGPSGIIFTVTGTNFRPFFPVANLTIGVPSVLPSSSITTDKDGSFTISNRLPQLPEGTHAVVATVGGLLASVSFKVSRPTGPPTPTPRPTPSPLAGPYVALAPLIEAGNLVRVWHFDPATQNNPPNFGWSLFDPRAVFASANTVREMRTRQFYWISVRDNQTVTLNGKERVFYSGWNPVTW